MPGGQASHKGHSIKPNTNANDVLNTAADLTIDPQAILEEEGNSSHRQEEAPQNDAATQRPQQDKER